MTEARVKSPPFDRGQCPEEEENDIVRVKAMNINLILLTLLEAAAMRNFFFSDSR